MLEFNIVPKLYIQDGDLVLELLDGDGMYISDCVIPLIELKEALDDLEPQEPARAAQDQVH